MPPLIVSEKTLELNICAELLGLLRSLPHCHAAFWIGMKQDQEARNGLDELITNLPAGMHLALQFKSPRSRPRDQMPYRFATNDKQNSSLLRLSARRPDAVYYVFPQYNTFTRMRSNSPNLLSDTHFLRVEDLRILPLSSNRLGTHVVETRPPIALVRSRPTEAKLALASDTLRNVLGREKTAFQESFVPHTLLKEWLEELVAKAEGNRRAIGQQLRGFSTFCIS